MSPITQLNAALPLGWSVERPLAQGGQGTVFVGKLNGVDAAIKLFGRLDDQRRVQRELALLAIIDSPNVVRVLGNTSVTVMGSDIEVVAYELIAGGSLENLLAAAPEHKLSALDLARLGAHAARGIETIWTPRVVHRDIKPANILQRVDSTFVLVDFGLARHLDLSDMTMPGASPGTTGYKSPEQARGRRSLTIHSDLYSLGLTMYKAACGQHPFRNTQPLGSETPPTPIAQLVPGLHPVLSSTIDNLLKPIPSARPLVAGERFELALGDLS